MLNKRKQLFQLNFIQLSFLIQIGTGIFWGYQTRLADNISSVFTGSPFKDGELETHIQWLDFLFYISYPTFIQKSLGLLS